MNKYQRERLSKEIEQLALFIGLAYEHGLIEGATEGVRRDLKQLRSLTSEKIAIDDQLFNEARLGQRAA